MNSTNVEYHRGDIICRPAEWIDIVKFFLLNYGLHAVTVVTDPGSSWLIQVLAYINAILVPIFGFQNAMLVLTRFAIVGKTDLDVALRARALCMVVPRHSIKGYMTVQPELSDIHGQYPAIHSDKEGHPALNNYCLVLVPRWFTVDPIVNLTRSEHPTNEPPYPSRHRLFSTQTLSKVLEKVSRIFSVERFSEMINTFKGALMRRGEGGVTKPHISSNYNFIKNIAALLQILYGSYELYSARGNQLEKYGYAAYSITVIPYVMMSIMNLLANITSPQYPSLYLVHYGGEESVPEERSNFSGPTPGNNEGDDHSGGTNGKPIKWPETKKEVSGVVGIVYGKPETNPPHTDLAVEDVITILFLLIMVGTPYITIYLLTGFNPAQSTRSQRFWIMCWITMGLSGGSFNHFIDKLPLSDFRMKNPFQYIFLGTLLTTVFSFGTMGGLVVVGQMIYSNPVCKVI